MFNREVGQGTGRVLGYVESIFKSNTVIYAYVTRFRTDKIFKKSRHGFDVFYRYLVHEDHCRLWKGVKTVEKKTGPLICDASQLEGPLGCSEPGCWVGGPERG